ncbi:hypothetical protein HRI_004646600 [Hibiscus trionum]|uniref:Cyclin-dependent kinase inhibitor domain-containing protein n=1 Tax=Hibiscus trionum TaxID=183268 RepID=A0A9W7MPE2_HIBTR|nr:hypothetical protein HRI_004646600 [Hibiscus trionum]
MDSSSSSFPLSKRRKTVDSKESQQLELTSPDIKLGNTRRFISNSRNKPISVSTLSNSGGVLLTGELCSNSSSGEDSSDSNESCDIVKYSLRFVDLKAKSFETEISTCINVNKFSAETIPTIELIGDSEETAPPHRKKPPSQAELDEFFAAAEKYEQVRFAEKYNYDIVKDVPLDGRYQWIQLKP